MNRQLRVLLADDSPEFGELLRQVLAESRVGCWCQAVTSHAELMDYLHHQGRFSPPTCAPRPDVILLDWAFSGAAGRQILEEIKHDPDLRSLPVIVLTANKSPLDITQSYRLGGTSLMVKPASRPRLVDVMETFLEYWSKVVQLPAQPGGYV